MLALGDWDSMGTMGKEEGQRQRVKTRMGRTKGDFLSCSASLAAVEHEQGCTNEP